MNENVISDLERADEGLADIITDWWRSYSLKELKAALHGATIATAPYNRDVASDIQCLYMTVWQKTEDTKNERRT